MKAAWIDKACGLPIRQLHLVGGGLLLCVATALWFAALHGPLAALRALRAEQQRLAAAALDPQPLAAQLAALQAQVRALSQPLAQAGAAQEQVGLIGQIGRLAAAHGVALSGATPAPEQPVMAFDQAGFDADASGRYDALLAWMAALEVSGPGLSVAGFEMHPATPGPVGMKIRVAAYRPQKGAP